MFMGSVPLCIRFGEANGFIKGYDGIFSIIWS